MVDRLQSLMENSLILQAEGADGAPRFRMLETLQEYALERLVASGEASAVHQQHTTYYLQMAETAAPHLETAERHTWLVQLEAEHDNLRTALAWSEVQPDGAETMLRLALALAAYWYDRKHLGEGVSWFERALARPVRPSVDASHTPSNPDQFRRLRARVLLEAGGLAHMWCALDQARAYYDEDIALYEELGDTAGLAHALAGAGLVARDANDDAAAVALLERSVAIRRTTGEYSDLCDVLCSLGITTRSQGNYGRSEAVFTEALDLARAAHDPGWIAGALLELGTLALHQQFPSRAVSALEESVRLFRGQEVTFDLGWALIHLAEARRVARDALAGAVSAEDDIAALKQCWEEGLLIVQESKARQIIGQALLETGELAYEQVDDARAAQLLSQSLAAFHELGLVQDIGHVLDAIAPLLADGSQPWALRRAVQLWSGATKWHQNKPRLSPIRRSRYDRTFAAARSRLGEALFAAAWEEGQQLSPEQAVAYALEELQDD
ncbi:MAG TPA: hypothetical protein VEZ12_11930 [Herpetosiphonaceae bacterium]|nr:hypothetical protein [Herpetosiphonaceae bacterium]